MNRIFCGALLLFASIAVAQQQASPPIQLPPNSTPPTFPQEQNPRTPPDVAPPHCAPNMGAANAQLPAAELARQIQQKFETEPILQSSTLRVAVDDDNVTLNGTVDNEQEHQIALRIARANAGDRNVVDRIKIRG